MKRTLNTRESRCTTPYARVAAAALAFAVSAPPAVAIAEGEEPSLQMTLVGTGAFSSHDEAQFRQRHRIPENGSGGIQSLHYESILGDDVELSIDGRAIFNNRDYLFDLELNKEDAGYFKAGFKQFRTWYDVSGGYHPLTSSYFVFNPEMGLNRGEAWAEGGLQLPAEFQLTLAYRYLYRDGQKSSIAWGDGLVSAPSTTKGIVPSYWDIDEGRHLFDADLRRKTEATTIGAGFRYENDKLDNRRQMTRRPGEVGIERRLTQRDNQDADTVGVKAYAEQRLFEDKVIVSGAYAYNDLDLDIGGSSRIYGAMFDSSYDPFAYNRQQRDEGFIDMVGGSEMREHVGNFSAFYRPFEDLTLIAGLRVRSEEIHGEAEFQESNVGGSPTFTPTLEHLLNTNETDETSWAEKAEARYTGIDNVVLYARGAWEQNDGDIHELEVDPATSALGFERTTDVERDSSRYAVGAKWFPVRKLSLSSEYVHSMRAYDYRHSLDTALNTGGDRYPAFLVAQDFETDDVNVRATLSPASNVRLVARYDYVMTTIETRGDLLSKIESADIESHILGGSVSWSPTAWSWVRSGVNWVRSTTDAAVNAYVSPLAAAFPPFDNDYVTADLGAGVLLDEKTEAEAMYHYYGANNYKDVSATYVPYGAEATEHGAGVRVTRAISDNAKIGVGYAYFNNDEVLAGGADDYDAHIVSTSVELAY